MGNIFNEDQLVDIIDSHPYERNVTLIQEKLIAEKKDLYDFFLDEIRRLHDIVTTNKSLINNLVEKFFVLKNGDALNTTHEIIFNKNNSLKPKDETSIRIFNDFIRSYELDLLMITEELQSIRDKVSGAKRSIGRDTYCEVDIFNSSKKPVEC